MTNNNPSIPETKIKTTLLQHYYQEYDADERNDMTLLFNGIQQACKSIAALVRVAPLEGLLGKTGGKNSMGEEVQTLDIMSNDLFIDAMRRCGKVCAMVSEENAEIIDVPPENRGPFVVCFDPIDGSSNIDNAIPVGSIFAIYKRRTEPHEEISIEKDILQPGENLLAAGYSIYGSCTSIVIATQKAVNGFTLDPVSGEFVLSHPNMKIKQRGSVYSVNEGNSASWHNGTRRYVLKNKDLPKPPSLRYVGSMIADIHRTLITGGVFMYPADKKSPNGKLRLLYECNPMSFVVERAGGKSTTGKERILSILPEQVHQRCPIYIGSPDDIDEILACM